jgi:hypothetical protein
MIGIGTSLRHARGAKGPVAVFSSTLSWNSSTDTYVTTSAGALVNVHQKMRRCVLNSSGVVQYYLSATDSTQKAGGGAATLTGADGNVMVEIPKFWYRHTLAGTVNTWEVADGPLAGFVVHPAFIKAGVEVSHRYIGAYDACYLDATDGLYKSGLNLDNMSANLDLANDKLASVSGVYPLVGVTRAQCRTLAANNGTGWHQLDFALWSAVQMLYLTEYGTFNSQATLGAGNTNGSYLGSSADQNQSPHTIAGASNALGNASTNTTTGAGVNAKPGTSFMSYRGIENFYGNCWNWCDGINVNVTTAGNVHITNDYRNFADDTATGYTLITSAFPTAAGFIRNILNTAAYFLSSTNSGGSSTTFVTDQHFSAASLSRGVVVGGSASNSSSAGVFCVFSSFASSTRDRSFGARLCW